MNPIEKFKKIIKGLRGNRSRYEMSKLCDMPTHGSWQGLEIYGNPTLLTLCKISKGANVSFVISNGKLNIK